MAVSGSSFRTRQRLMISAASSAVATFNSPGRGAAHLQVCLTRGDRKNFSSAAPVSPDVCARGCMFPAREEQSSYFLCGCFKHFYTNIFIGRRADFATKCLGMPAAVFPQLVYNLHSSRISPPAIRFLLCDTHWPVF